MMEKNERFLSLDVFRGLTVCFMIIVNSAGPGAAPYAPLDHAEWFGFTPADLVFPSFLFAVGNALSFSKNKYAGNAAFLAKVFKRTVIIFLLGYLMYWFPFFHREEGRWVFNAIGHTRILGVLQRIALCYCMGALITHYLSRKWIIVVAALLLLGYWAILYLFAEPGQELTMLGNAGTRLDVFVMGNDHLYHQGGGPIAFDPEGILSTLPAIVNVIGGYLAGIFIQQKGKNFETIASLLMAAAVMIFIALFWAQFFPLAKKLWTNTFVLLTLGLDLVMLGLLIYLVELKQWKRGTGFLLVFGKNPLAIYLLSELLLTCFYIIMIQPAVSFTEWINQFFFQAVFPGPLGSLLFAVCYMLLCWLVGYWLNKRKIYIRI
jgi:predicted acyltransferase